jgi:hypothetical protein
LTGAEQSKNEGKDRATITAQQVALELAKAFRALALYPLGHPQLKAIFHASYQKIVPEVNRFSELMFTVGKDGLHFQGKLLENVVDALGEFAMELHIRQVRKFAFRQNLLERDFLEFLRMALIRADEFRSGKRIEEYFREKEITTIWVNEVDFSKMLLGKKTEPENEDLDEESQDFYRARLLVDTLDLAGDDNQAIEILAKIDNELAKLAGDKKLPELWFLTGAVSDFFEQKNKMFPGAGKKAQALVKSSARPEFLTWLTERYTTSDENSGHAFERYFDQVGEPALQFILERVISPEAVYFQKQLIGYLKNKGEQARPFLEAKLREQKGAQARKLIYMLGELRNPESAQILIEFAERAEKGIKSEAIRALGKIKSRNVSFALVGMLRAKNLDDECRLVLIPMLGDLQEQGAVPGLMEILKNRNEAPELREKAAEALGKIGSREAMSVLSEVLEKSGMFRKPAPEKVRMKCAEALARMGGERVEFLLQDLSEGEGLLAQYCRELLSQMLAKKGR